MSKDFLHSFYSATSEGHFNNKCGTTLTYKIRDNLIVTYLKSIWATLCYHVTVTLGIFRDNLLVFLHF